MKTVATWITVLVLVGLSSQAFAWGRGRPGRVWGRAPAARVWAPRPVYVPAPVAAPCPRVWIPGRWVWGYSGWQWQAGYYQQQVAPPVAYRY